MKVARYMALLVVLGIILPIAAFAQYETDEHTKLNLKVGLYRPSDSTTTNALGHNWSLVELIYDCKRDDMHRPIIQAELGQLESSSGSDSALVMAVNKLWWREAKGSNSLYYGAGVGAYKMNLFDQKDTKPSGQLLVGYSFKESYFAELRETIVSPMTIGGTDFSLSGLTLSVGTRKLF